MKFGKFQLGNFFITTNYCVIPVSNSVGFVSHSECFDAVIEKLELSRNGTLIDKMEGMGKRIELHEDLVKRLKVLSKH